MEEEAERPNEHSVQCCIEFSIMTKLEGLWYKMGNHFIEGKLNFETIVIVLLNLFLRSEFFCSVAKDLWARLALTSF